MGQDFLALDHERTDNVLYLHQRWTKVPKPAEELAEAAAEPTKMAIGVEGGFNVDDDAKFDIVKEHALVVMPGGVSVPYPNHDLPTVVCSAVDAVLSHAGFHEQEEVAGWWGCTS